jgi:hypothetical protein
MFSKVSWREVIANKKNNRQADVTISRAWSRGVTCIGAGSVGASLRMRLSMVIWRGCMGASMVVGREMWIMRIMGIRRWVR